jgi:hypothetical protein
LIQLQITRGSAHLKSNFPEVTVRKHTTLLALFGGAILWTQPMSAATQCTAHVNSISYARSFGDYWKFAVNVSVRSARASVMLDLQFDTEDDRQVRRSETKRLEEQSSASVFTISYETQLTGVKLVRNARVPTSSIKCTVIN